MCLLDCGSAADHPDLRTAAFDFDESAVDLAPALAHGEESEVLNS